MKMGLCMCVIFAETIVLFSSQYNGYIDYSIFVVFLLLYFLVVTN